MNRNYGLAALDREEAKVRSAQPGNRNNTIYKATLRLAGLVASTGITEAEIEERLVDAALARGLDETEAVTTIRSGLTAGAANPRSVPSPITSRAEALPLVQVWFAVVRDDPQDGRLGGLAAISLPVVARLALEAGGPRGVPISCRRVAVELGISPTRGARGLRELQVRGYLLKTRHARHGYPNHYSLTHPEPPSPVFEALDPDSRQDPKGSPRERSDPRVLAHRSTHTLLGPPCNQEREIDDLDPGHDAFRAGALGESGWRILDRLLRHPDPATQSALAEALGMTPGTVNRHVRPNDPLVALGLVVRTASGALHAPSVPSTADLDQIAHDLGTAGTRDRARQRVRDEYIEQGRLDEDRYWLDAETGERKGRATWL